MFGLKFIRTKEYDNLLWLNCDLKDRLDRELKNRQAVLRKVERLEKDYQDLRKEINQISMLKDYVVLHENNFPCENCKLEGKDCLKLEFADRTICVCPKSEINSFKQRKTRKYRKNK